LNTAINVGARFSGKLNKNLRIGVMDMETAGNDEGIAFPELCCDIITAKSF
jgi:hypothetical protein